MTSSAYALEATLQELFLLAGPLIVAALAAGVSASAALMAATACATFGTATFTATSFSRAWRPAPRAAGPTRGALTVPGLRTIMAASFGLGAAFAALEVSMPAVAERIGTREAGGVAMAAVSLGSGLGGLAAGALPPPRDPARRFVGALALVACGFLLPSLARSLPALCALGLVAGLPIAVVLGTAYGLIDRLAPSGTATEAFAWMSTAVTGGFAAGSALAGWVVGSAGPSRSLLLAAGAAGVALLAAVLGRGTLGVPTARM